MSRCGFSNIATEQMLYTEKDIESSMDKIETINFHQVCCVSSTTYTQENIQNGVQPN